MANGEQQPGGLERVAGRIQKAGISFLTGIPQIELDRQAAELALTEAQAGDLRQQAETERLAAQSDLDFQNLSRAAFGRGPNADLALQEIFARDPAKANELFSGLGVVEQSEREGVARRAAEIQATPPDQRRSVILNQAAEIEARGGDARQTLSLLDMPIEDQDNRLRIIQAAALSTKERQTGLEAGAASKLGQSVVTRDPTTGQLSFATPVLTGTQIETQQTPITGEIVSRQLGETPAAVQQRAIETAGGTTAATKIAARDQEFIDVGQRQADATAIIRRGLQLLETMETGTLEQAQLAGRNLLGIAGADETELNANLGKAVLAQLRSTFGAQFTEREGARLEGVEAGFGKSTAGNRRLLELTLRGMERDARRGITTAQRVEDPFAAKEIEDALRFSLIPGQPTGAAELPTDTSQVTATDLEFMTPEQRTLFGQ